MDKSILETVLEGAKDLYEAGVMDDEKLREFEALCLPSTKGSNAQKAQYIQNKNKAE